MLFHVWHSSVFFLPHSIYVEFFGVFESFSPVHTKSPKQWKYDVWHHRFQKTYVSPVHTKTISWRLEKSTLGSVFNPLKYRLRVSGKLTGEKRPVPYQKYPVTCGLGLRWTNEACFVTRPLVVSTWNSPFSYPSPCIDLYVRGFFDGDSSSSESTPGLWQSFDTFFL